jgi:lipoate-protein ligase A
VKIFIYATPIHLMRCEEKVPNGQLVCVSVKAEEGQATEVRITGDFFLHPEDAIERIEQSLHGIPVDMDESEVASRIEASLEGAQLIGATAEDLARIFKKAVSQ